MQHLNITLIESFASLLEQKKQLTLCEIGYYLEILLDKNCRVDNPQNHIFIAVKKSESITGTLI